MGIRELALLLGALPICVAGLVLPRIGLYGYIWFAIVRPDYLAFVPEKYPLSLAFAACTLVGSVRLFGEFPRVLRNPFTIGLLLLQIPLGISVLNAIDPSLAEPRYQDYIKMILIMLLIPFVIRTRTEVVELFLVLAACQGFLGLKFGSYGLLQGGASFHKGWGPQLNNNGLAIALGMSIPLCWYAQFLVDRRWLRLLFMAMAFGCMTTAVMTGSRAGAIGAAISCVFIAWRSKRRIATFALMAVLGAGAIYFVRESFLPRMATVLEPKKEASAASRFDHAEAAYQIWKRHPVTGVGFGAHNYAALAWRYLGRANLHGAHNTYMQLLVDSGIFALLFYCGLLFGGALWLGSAARAPGIAGTRFEAIPLGLQATLLAYSIPAATHSLERYDFPYMLFMAAACWWSVMPAVQATQEPQPEADQAPAREPALVTFQGG